jgi:hypothetical protein
VTAAGADAAVAAGAATASGAKTEPFVGCNEGGRKAALVVLTAPAAELAFVAKLLQNRARYPGIVDREGGGCYPTLKGGGTRSESASA